MSSPDVETRSLNSLPHFIGHGVAPDAAKQEVELGIFSREFFDTLDIFRTMVHEQIFKWAGGEGADRFVREITFVSCHYESPKQLTLTINVPVDYLLYCPPIRFGFRAGSLNPGIYQLI